MLPDYFPPAHFSIDSWFDFAYGCVSPEQHQLMQGHLDAGCTHCGTLSKAWLRPLDLGRRESHFQVPAGTVQFVKTSFRWRELWQWRPQTVVSARLVFDSSRHVPTMQFRGSVASSRHLLHETELFVIDLRVEEDSARKRVRLTGQILNSKEPSRQIQKAHVTLLSGEALAAESPVGSSGEFDLEYSNEPALELFVDIQGQDAIWIALPAQVAN